MALAQSRQAESKQHLAVVRSCHERGLEVARMMAEVVEVVLDALSAVADVVQASKWVCYILTQNPELSTNGRGKPKNNLV